VRKVNTSHCRRTHTLSPSSRCSSGVSTITPTTRSRAGSKVIVDFSILSTMLCYLVLTEIESVVSSSSDGVIHRHRRARDAEKGQRNTERRRQRFRHSVDERARAAPGERSG